MPQHTSASNQLIVARVDFCEDAVYCSPNQCFASTCSSDRFSILSHDQNPYSSRVDM